MRTTDIAQSGDTSHDGGHGDEGHEHPSDAKYIQIAAILGVLTALEVSTYFVNIGPALIPTLMVMMGVKFFLVAAWFMHLRFDSSLFTKFFVGGLVLATGVYMIALTAFEFWTKG
jgi:cytochrome c oxidase subunit 4